MGEKPQKAGALNLRIICKLLCFARPANEQPAMLMTEITSRSQKISTVSYLAIFIYLWGNTKKHFSDVIYYGLCSQMQYLYYTYMANFHCSTFVVVKSIETPEGKNRTCPQCFHRAKKKTFYRISYGKREFFKKVQIINNRLYTKKFQITVVLASIFDKKLSGHKCLSLPKWSWGSKDCHVRNTEM